MGPAEPSPGRVTVVIPTYNRAGLLPRAIESVLQQTVRSVCDIVVVDDGSTDETPRIIKRYGRDVWYVQQRNSGVATARNAGLAARPNEFAAFLDSDDAWRPAKLERQLDALRRFPQAVLCATRVRGFGSNGSAAATPPAGLADGHPHDLAPALFDTNLLCTSSVVLRGGALARVGTFRRDLRICEDYHLWLRIACLEPGGARSDSSGLGILLPDELTLYDTSSPGSLASATESLLLAELRVRYLSRPLLRKRPDCRAAWARGTARALATLRDIAYREERYWTAAGYAFRSLVHQPDRRPRWEWARCVDALARAATL